MNKSGKCMGLVDDYKKPAHTPETNFMNPGSVTNLRPGHRGGKDLCAEFAEL